jgi:hypothetical protein
MGLEGSGEEFCEVSLFRPKDIPGIISVCGQAGRGFEAFVAELSGQKTRAVVTDCVTTAPGITNVNYAVRMVSDLSPEMAACAAASRAIGTR